MSCDVFPCDGLSSVVLCNKMECYEVVMRLVVSTLRGSKWLCDDVVIQSTTLLKSTTMYYKVLLCTTKYYSLLQSTTQYYNVVLFSTTLDYKVPLSTTIYYSVLKSTTQYESTTHETSSTMRGATGVILQLHQILRLPRKMALALMMEPYLLK